MLRRSFASLNYRTDPLRRHPLAKQICHAAHEDIAWFRPAQQLIQPVPVKRRFESKGIRSICRFSIQPRHFQRLVQFNARQRTTAHRRIIALVMSFIAFCHASGIAIWATVQTARNRVPCCIRPVDFRFIHFPTSHFFVEYVTHHRISLSFRICPAHGHSIGCSTYTPSVVNHSRGCIRRMRPYTPSRKVPDARQRDTIRRYTGFQIVCIARPQMLYTPCFHAPAIRN